jgi:hypothetical protein
LSGSFNPASASSAVLPAALAARAASMNAWVNAAYSCRSLHFEIGLKEVNVPSRPIGVVA